MVVEAPFQAHEVLHRSDALVHGAQLRLTQALQSRLHAFHPAGGKQAYLVSLQIALGFDEHVEIAAVCANVPNRFSTYFMSMMLSTRRNRVVS